ncbi:hypothetical protein CFIMG_007288RA00001 [Ceratocystis fimbriata CBS 114723]|uniref:Vacuolar morphogenesis protein 7-like protein n=1 Tax=Ceratocystis fimbriata CBS 114723 TaxID=1035309 RepID=A0A2C5XHV5_9PEZI|nr:hypothetical protein CFIMG_007288RA00001 [Ceratocystis fimbriata CBS 114723]
MAPPAEISIPSTIVASPDAKPYTLYNITLRLPLRSFVVQKRYSDFAALQTALATAVGTPPPSPLPGKSWIKSTVSSPELTETRRAALETYLRAIAESPDRRWRETSAWRSFLNLPSTSAPSSSVSAGGLIKNVAGVGAQDPSTWLDMHREMKMLLQEARNCLSRRDAAVDANNTAATVEAGTGAKRALSKANGLLHTLSEGLSVIQERGRLGDGELRRRRDLLMSAKVEREGLEKLSNTISSTPSLARTGAASSSDKMALFGPTSSLAITPRSGRVIGAPVAETDQTRELDNTGVLQLQQQMMQSQDQSLDQLAAIVRRQKDMGLAIKDEVERHVEMLDRVNEDVDRVSGKVRVARNRIKKLAS